MGIFKKPKKPDPPPQPPSTADATVQMAGDNEGAGYTSLVNTGPKGLLTKPITAKRTLIGGAA